MIKTIAQGLLAENILQNNDRVVVGVSGGADSMALLHILLAMNRQAGWQLDLHVAHLNHQLRGQAAETDATFVKEAADKLSLPCTIERRDIARIASEHGLSVEEVGRNQRYAFFERVCIRTGARIVAVGHHADDDAETVLHRVLRGTGLRGLGGIRRSRPLAPGSYVRVIRPLLRCTRETLRDFLNGNNIAFREDESNESLEPMRNRIRLKLLPLIASEVNPQVRDALTRLKEQAAWLQEFLGETVQRTFDTLVVSRTDQDLVLNAKVLARKSRIVQTEIIRLAYRSFGLGEQDLSYANLVAALDLLRSEGSGKQTQLPGGMHIEKRYNQLVFALPSDQPRETIAEEIAVHLPGRTVLPIRRLEIECAISDVAEADVPELRSKAGAQEEHVDYASVRPPLVVRGRKPGDRFVPLGAPGSKKLSEFLSDNKVAASQRERVAVLCDQLGPIWVIGHRIDERVKLTARSRRVLSLRAKSLSS